MSVVPLNIRRVMAKEVWREIRANLEDRSVLDLGDLDEDLLKEVEREQIMTISAMLG